MDGEHPAGTRPAADEQPAGGNRATGDDRVDEAVAGLASLADKPVEEHPAVLDDIHARLGQILGEAGQAGEGAE
jgi:hypothetical protein